MFVDYVVVDPATGAQRCRLELGEPGELAETEIGRRLCTAYQEAVGGYIELYSGFAGGLDVYVNEEGLPRRLAPNQLAVALLRRVGVPVNSIPVGPVLIVGYDDQSLTEEQCALLLAK